MKKIKTDEECEHLFDNIKCTDCKNWDDCIELETKTIDALKMLAVNLWNIFKFLRDKCETCRFVYCHERSIHDNKGCEHFQLYGKCSICKKDIEDSYKKMPTFPEQHLCKEHWWKKNGIPGEFCPGR